MFPSLLTVMQLWARVSKESLQRLSWWPHDVVVTSFPPRWLKKRDVRLRGERGEKWTTEFIDMFWSYVCQSRVPTSLKSRSPMAKRRRERIWIWACESKPSLCYGNQIYPQEKGHVERVWTREYPLKLYTTWVVFSHRKKQAKNKFELKNITQNFTVQTSKPGDRPPPPKKIQWNKSQERLN